MVAFVHPAGVIGTGDNRRRSAFSAEQHSQSDSGFWRVFYLLRRSCGKRLVLDYVSAFADVKAGEQLRFVIQTTVDSNIVDYRLVQSAIDNVDGTVSLTANQAMSICADGGTRVVLQIFRDKPASSSKAGFAISGSLVSM